MARDLEDLGLSVTSESDRSDTEPGIWTQITQAVVEAFGAEQVELACAATVFAATTADRLVEVRAAAPCCGFSQSMPTAPTRFGRVVDTVATWPLLRWVPGLR